ncbi:MAG: glycoside hydrolase family 15 protein [Actinobacteria bacterium]|nr:glycoside hydrolase family 15 protein [Actinomycetota bacterium]
MSTVAIADHALLSDRHSAALVTRDGSVDWLCLPRFDSRSVFGRLLDDEAGHWSITAVGADNVSRRYLDRTMVLETTFRTPTGTLRLVDALSMGPGNRGHALGVDVPHLLLRCVMCTRGDVNVATEYVPRPEYGLIHPMLEEVEGGVSARGGADVLVLSSPRPLTIDGSSATGQFRLREGQSVAFALHHCLRADRESARVWTQDDIDERLQDTVAAWESWSHLHQAYEGPWRDLVHQSGRVLQALSFQPTGAICAAATTSLPESEGGVRNWDYRYSWVRDACFTIEALWVAACPDEANEFFDYLATSAATSVDRGNDLQIMFGIGGERDLTERELPHLSGWRNSAPVRVGNGAWSQRQIDVYGELLNSVYRLSDQLTDLAPATKRFLVNLADAAAVRWRDKDQGIWEIRGEPRDFVYSKLMCWVALERAIALADRLDAHDKVDAWKRTQEEIRDAIVMHGWSDEANAFTQSFGSTALDASNLMMPAIGFLPPDDPRILATIDAIAERLTDDRGLVYRYRTHDGLEGEEGTFLLCTFWLAQAMAVSGQPERAREVFERAVRFANDVGLLSEEVDAATGELLGNFPQAFSHIGLVNAAWAISQAEKSASVLTDEPA